MDQQFNEIMTRLAAIDRKATRLDELAMATIALGAGAAGYAIIYGWFGSVLLAVIGGIGAFCAVGYSEIRLRR